MLTRTPISQNEQRQKAKELEEEHSKSFKILQTQFEQILALKDKELTEARDRVQALSASHHTATNEKNDDEYQRHIEGYEVCTSVSDLFLRELGQGVANEKC